MDISEIDADGIGQRRLTVYGQQQTEAARLLVLAMSLPGGLDEATQLVRAALIKAEAGDG